MSDNQRLLIACRKLIEKKLGWGDSSNWKSRDFENLSEQIFEKTKVVLSSSTLKRIWGKVRYESTPNVSTLNALARFLDYATWRDFVSSEAKPNSKNDHLPLKFRNAIYKKYAVGIFIALCVAILGLFLLKSSSLKLKYDDAAFTSSPVTLGVPNTVVFHYDATLSNADSVFIQQNWDSSRRFKVDKEKHDYASTYYIPGYYRAKLVFNDSIVREHDIFIESQHWIGLFDRHPVPIYLPNAIYDHGDWWGIKDLNAIPSSVELDKTHSPFMLTRVSKEWDIPSHNFALDLGIQNVFDHPSNPCQQTKILLIGTEGVISIPLSALGCVGELNLILGKKLIEGSTNNLSAFGVDFSRPIQLTCQSVSDSIEIKLDKRTIFRDDFKEGIGRIVGVRIVFDGVGYINNFNLRKIQ